MSFMLFVVPWTQMIEPEFIVKNWKEIFWRTMYCSQGWKKKVADIINKTKRMFTASNLTLLLGKQ